MKKRLMMGLAAGGLMAAMVPGVASAAEPVAGYFGFCRTESGDLRIIRSDEGGPRLIGDYASNVASGDWDDCVSGFVELYVDGVVVHTTDFGPRSDL